MDALEIKKQNDKEKSMMFKERVLKAKQTVHENSLMKREKVQQSTSPTFYEAINVNFDPLNTVLSSITVGPVDSTRRSCSR